MNESYKILTGYVELIKEGSIISSCIYSYSDYSTEEELIIHESIVKVGGFSIN